VLEREASIRRLFHCRVGPLERGGFLRRERRNEGKRSRWRGRRAGGAARHVHRLLAARFTLGDRFPVRTLGKVRKLDMRRERGMRRDEHSRPEAPLPRDRVHPRPADCATRPAVEK
jgi:hypothetical protein